MAKSWVKGTFIKRLNRFSAQVIIEGANDIETVHVANTARLKELLVPEASVRLTLEAGAHRKTAYTLRQVKFDTTWVSIDSNQPNHLVKSWIESGEWPIGFQGPVVSEYTWGNSRFDLYLPKDNRLIEVKGVTLIKGEWAMFPDAPTVRGTKHVRELINFCATGGKAAIVFVCQRSDAHQFKPYAENDPEFARALNEAAAMGVAIHVLRCKIDRDRVDFDGELPYVLT